MTMMDDSGTADGAVPNDNAHADPDAGRRENRAARKAREARIIGPVAGLLRRASTLSVTASLLWLVQAASLAWVVDGWVQGDGALRQSLWGGGIFLAVALIRGLLDYGAGGLLFRAADQVIGQEREALIAREALAPGAASARIAALMAQKLPLLQPWITRYRVAMVRTMIVPIVFLAVTFYISWAVGLVLLVAGPLIPVFMALVGMAAEQVSRRQLDEIGTMNEMLMDRLAALQDIRLLGATERAAEDFEARAETLRERTMAVLKIAFLSSTVLELFAALGVAMVAVLVGFALLGVTGWITWGAPLTLAQGLFMLIIAPDFFQPMRDLAAAWHDRASGMAVAAELDELDAAPRQALVGAGALVAPLPGALSVESRAAMVDLGGRALRLPDMVVQAGEAVALTGPSGAGKTTTLAAIAGLLPVSSGVLDVCGQALDAATADAWRARLAMVPQQVHFADETLQDFLDPSGTGDDPWEALEQADAAHFVRRLPEGLNTRLGETGGGVSGGEARRLMLARALLSGAEMLLVDEPTADLDPETAGRIIEALGRAKASGHTLLVATHDDRMRDALDRVVEVTA